MAKLAIGFVLGVAVTLGVLFVWEVKAVIDRTGGWA